MKLEKFDTDALWSAVKRRQVRDLLVAVFENIEGCEKLVEELKTTSRLSDAKISRLKDIMNGVSEGQTTIDAEVVGNEDGLKDSVTFEKLKKAISKGKKKKAEKIAKQLRDAGYGGAIIDALEKQIETME